jgi:hypothetical protein
MSDRDLEKDIEAARLEMREMGGDTCLPGMSDNDFDHCTCGQGWPMGCHHVWHCPAHCCCGTQRGPDTKKQTCSYHSGMMKIPVGPSVMTERWDLKNLNPELRPESGGQRPEAETDVQQNL